MSNGTARLTQAAVIALTAFGVWWCVADLQHRRETKRQTDELIVLQRQANALLRELHDRIGPARPTP
jgi:hypothetical protein